MSEGGRYLLELSREELNALAEMLLLADTQMYSTIKHEDEKEFEEIFELLSNLVYATRQRIPLTLLLPVPHL